MQMTSDTNMRGLGLIVLFLAGCLPNLEADRLGAATTNNGDIITVGSYGTGNELLLETFATNGTAKERLLIDKEHYAVTLGSRSNDIALLSYPPGDCCFSHRLELLVIGENSWHRVYDFPSNMSFTSFSIHSYDNQWIATTDKSI